METIPLKLPDTLDEDELLRLPATWEEYAELASNTSYTIQFLNGEIIVSQATDTHEVIVGMMIWLLNNAYLNQPEYRIMGSNVKIVIPEHDSDFNADASVVRGPSEYGLTPAGNVSTMRITNPEIIVEVLSKSTREFDLTEKITYYKLIPSLQYILFVDQYRPFVSVYARTNVPDEWLNHDYRTLESIVRMGDIELPLEAIYRKTVFGK